LTTSAPVRSARRSESAVLPLAVVPPKRRTGTVTRIRKIVSVSDWVLVVVAPAGHSALLDAGLAKDLADLAGAPSRALSPERALEAPIPAGRLEAARDFVRERISPLPLDWALLPAAGRRKRLLVCDMDSTAITVECIDELAERAGVRARVADITRRAMAGELVFEEALRARVALLAGLPLAELDRVIRERVALTDGLRTLLATMRAHGAFCVLVSGGFTEFTRVVRMAAGFDMDRANRLEIVDGRLTGRLRPPILGRDGKREILEEVAGRRGLALADTCALGDGANDLAMIRAAGLGVGYRPQALLREAADAVIEHGDLATLLYFQGYAEEEIVRPGPARLALCGTGG